MTSTEETVRQMISRGLGVKPEKLNGDDSLTDDLGADSLHIVELIMALEDEFSFDIEEDDFKRIRTVQEVIDYITEIEDSN